MSEIKSSPDNKEVKISLTTEIDGKEISFDINGSYTVKETIVKDNNNNKPALTWFKILKFFLLPYLILIGLFCFGYANDSSYFWLLFSLPIIYGYIFFTMIIFTTERNIEILRKLSDMITLLSSLIAACYLIFTSLGMVRPLTYFTSGNLLISLLVFSILMIFASFSSIKLCFSIKDFFSYYKK
ncbi:hypothetical protein H4F52_08490 [Pectobacterium brasiliense]|uniref:hypothetical protein n=1 Tax=Pectobacterium brasiliense TaxID=180957 RepID=UPI001968B433|nr:hypothetical protein [Pectobacterium brasiliense]MBN3131775.1 hypothetical protein [Pectobacterium brasiliense]